jgi:hypothetical protein
VICPSGARLKTLSSTVSKNIPLHSLLETPLWIPPSRPSRGAFRDRHERWVRDAVDAAVRETGATVAYGEVVWS